MIGRTLVWASPPKAPTIILISLTETISSDLDPTEIKRIKIGASFCHVVKIRAEVQDRLPNTPGNQKWNGAIPVFTIRAEIIINWERGVISCDAGE